MVVNEQLNRIIRGYFSDKKNEIRMRVDSDIKNAYKEHVKSADVLVKAVYDEINADSEIRLLIDTAKSVYASYEKTYGKKYGTKVFSGLKSISLGSLFKINIESIDNFYYNSDVAKKLSHKGKEEMDALDRQYDLLCLKLSYSESFDTVIAMLGEFGIKL